MKEGFSIVTEVVLPSDYQSLIDVEKIVGYVCDEFGVQEDAFGNVLIAVSEAVNNAIQHGNKNNPKAKDIMKNISIQFTHPIKGVIRLFKSDENCASHIIKVSTNENDLLNFSLAAIAKGKWTVILNWEHEDQYFIYNRSIAIL